MNASHRLFALAALLLSSHGAQAETVTIPETFDSAAIDGPEAYTFAKQCMPSLDEATFERIVRDAGDKNTVSTRTKDRGKPYLTLSAGKQYCIHQSEAQYPILPTSVFDSTIDFPDMAKEEAKRLRTDLATQLATTGMATALIINDKGNAYRVAYLFASDMPVKFYYHAHFMKQGSFSETELAAAYKGGNSMSVSARGSAGRGVENVKNFFGK